MRIDFNDVQIEIPSFEEAIGLAIKNLSWVQGYLINDDPVSGGYTDIFIKDCARLVDILKQYRDETQSPRSPGDNVVKLPSRTAR